MTVPGVPLPERAAAVTVERLSCRFGAVTALRAVDLTLPRSAVVCLVGPNGAGKSTLLRVLATLLRPDEGTAAIAGLDVRSDARGVRESMAYVGHATMLHEHLTVLENLRLAALLHGAPAPDELGSQALGLAGLHRRRHARAGVLSRGMSRRLAVSLAIARRPPVLLLDEPYDGLDPEAAARLDVLLREAAGHGSCVLFASHDLARAEAMADRVVVLVAGSVAWSGTATQLPPGGLTVLYRGLSASSPITDRMPATASKAADRRLDSPEMGPEPLEAPAPARPPGIVATMAAVVWKDVLTELRSREIVPAMMIFALLLAVVFGLAMPADAAARLDLAPGALWVTWLFATHLGVARLMSGDSDRGGLEAMLASPTDRGALFAGKWLAGCVFVLAVEIVFLPVFVALLGIPIGAANVAVLAGFVALATVGWVAAGVLMAALTTRTRAREVLLPIVLYPAAVPLLLPGVAAVGAVLSGAPTGIGPALALIGAYDVIYWVLGFLLFGLAVEE